MTIRKQHTLEVSGSDWFHSMSKEQQQGYLEEHPDSKYAKEAKEKDAAPGKEPTSPAPKADGSQKTAPNPNSGSMAHLVKDAPNLSEADKKFFTDGSTDAGSKTRKSLAHHVKSKSKGIVASLKSQSKEWHAGCKAIHKLFKKTPLTDHDKAAIRTLSKDILVAVGSIAVGGGLAAGLAAVVVHLGEDLVKDLALKAFASGVIEAKVALAAPKEDADEKMMLKIVEQLAEFVANGDIPEDAWKKAVASLAKTKTGADKGKKPVKSSTAVESILARLNDA